MIEILEKFGHIRYICQAGNIISGKMEQYLSNKRKVIIVPSFTIFMDSKNKFDYCQDTKTDQTCEYELNDIDTYYCFINQKLHKGMFIPCDLDGNILEKPNIKNYDGKDTRNVEYDQACIKYQKATERVLFGLTDDWTVEELEIKGVFNGEKIEYLIHEMNSVGDQLYFIPKL